MVFVAPHPPNVLTFCIEHTFVLGSSRLNLLSITRHVPDQTTEVAVKLGRKNYFGSISQWCKPEQRYFRGQGAPP